MKISARETTEEPRYQRKAPIAKETPRKTLPGWAQAVDVAGVPFDTSQGCMWPLWGPEASSGHVCGQGKHLLNPGTVHERASSYCLDHHRRAYPSYSTKK